ncbi:hypothetical protein [Amycolatopsis speibonae]|uniref:Integral membrane plasmid transfer protein n=1 Tax=Amycolatopsis speibonae TaxID=1450224 RepID=A0ABV7P3C2_9PSEU
MTDEQPAGRYRTLLLDQLADERSKKGSIEQRGIAVITTSGTLVAVTLGFVALATRAPGFTLPHTAVILLVSALTVLVAAAVLGLLINVPARVPLIDAADLIVVAESSDWSIVDGESAREEYRQQARLLAGLRKVNRIRARALFGGLVLEVTAVLAQAASVVIVLLPLLQR